MKATIGVKLGLLLLLYTCGGFLNLATFYWFLIRVAEDEDLLEAAQRQGVLFSHLGRIAERAKAGEARDQAALQRIVSDLDQIDDLWREGGELDDRAVPPAPAALRPSFEDLSKRWAEVKPSVLRILREPPGPVRQQEYLRVQPALPLLAREAKEIVVALERRVRELRQGMLYLVLGIFVLDIALFVLGAWVTRRHVVRPLLLIAEGARRIQVGDFAHRIPTVSQDEVAMLARTFNEMSANVARLLAIVEAERQRSEDILASVPSGLLVLSASLRVASANPWLRELFGRPGDDLVGRALGEVLPLAGLDERVQEVARTGKPQQNLFFEIQGDPGRVLRVGVTRIQSTHAREGSGKGEEGDLLLTVEDLTEVERLREAARASEQRYRDLLEGIEAIVWEAEAETLRFSFVSQRAEAILGYPAQRWIDEPDFWANRVVHPDDRERTLSLLREARRLGETCELEYRATAADGRVLWLHCTMRPLCEKEGRTMLRGVMVDITERKSMQAQVLLADRLASVGVLAGGVAHEINNPLAYVMGNLDFIAEEIRRLGQELPPGRTRELEEALNDTREGAQRVRRIVGDLRTFSRGDEAQRGPVNLRRILELSCNMVWNEIRHRARLVKDFGAVPPVDADESRLGQVFVNLLLNAAQAIPEGQAEENEIRIVTRTDAQGWVVVEVRDTGSGIPPENLGRIFDPFFTTKPVGMGTGLGLSICHGIVTSFGGKISVESQLGQGSLFRVVLPPARSEERPRESPAPLAAPASRRARILLVDDEPAVCASLQRLLASEHDVVGVTRARDAIARLESGEEFDVILCDLMMPEMTGMELYAEIRRILPALLDRIVFLTGGAFTPRAQAFLEEVPNPRLEKPVDMRTLRAMIRERLGSLSWC
jgi:PAS domain S-box-containing protein